MDITKSIGITSRLDIEQEYFITSLMNYLDGMDLTNEIITDKIITKFSDMWKDYLSLEVPNGLRPTDVRKDELLNKFYATLEFILKRDLSRILSLYSWVEKMYTRIDSDNVSGVEGIIGSINNTINKLIKLNTNKSVGTNLKTFNLQETNSINTNTGSHNKYSGIIMPSLQYNVINSNIDIIPTTDVYKINKYTIYNNEIYNNINLNTQYYNYNSDNLTMDINISADNDFQSINIILDNPFSVEYIYTSIDGHKIDITETILGNNIQINNTNVLSSSKDAIQEGDNLYKYILFSPTIINNVTVTIKLTTIDSYMISLAQLVNKNNNIIKDFTLYETLLISKQLSGEEYRNDIKRLQNEIHTGTIEYQLHSMPFCQFIVKDIQVFNITQIIDSVIRFKPFITGKSIQNIKLWTDEIDPEFNISYFINPGDGNLLAISPINSNREENLELDFTELTTNYAELVINFEPKSSYVPIINGFALLIGEKDS